MRKFNEGVVAALTFWGIDDDVCPFFTLWSGQARARKGRVLLITLTLVEGEARVGGHRPGAGVASSLPVF